ncbi:MAG TPA: hypothetical protein VE522_04055 [Actinomycetota bacterium]|nr:hypothetical protein [Actinomycetota bacterium]
MGALRWRAIRDLPEGSGADARALAEWHLGRIEWRDALLDDLIRVHGPKMLARALPTWNRRSAVSRLAKAAP